MPIIVKDHTLTESPTDLHLSVPLRGVHPSKLDIHCTDTHFKLSFPPYLFEIDFRYPVNDELSTASISGGVVVVKFPKAVGYEFTWSEGCTVSADEVGGGEGLRKRRQEALDRSIRKEEDKKRGKLEEKRRQEQYLVQQQIQVEREARERVEELREREKREMLDEVKGWVGKAVSDDKVEKVVEEDVVDEVDNEEEEVDSTKQQERSEEIFGEDDVIPVSAEQVENEEEEEEDPELIELERRLKAQRLAQRTANHTSKSVPPPRRSAHDDVAEITVSFTKRILPFGAARESKDAEYEEYVRRKKIAEQAQQALEQQPAPTTNTTDSKGLEEENPMFLKDKGNTFFQKGDFASAINAYTSALSISPRMLPCLSNRAACFLATNQHEQCLLDIQMALTIIDDEERSVRDGGLSLDPKLVAMRCKLLVRRGGALWKLGKLKSGLEAYQMALAIDPKNEALKVDVERLTKEFMKVLGNEGVESGESLVSAEAA